MRAAIYTRVSTFDQVNGYSLDMQEFLAIDYCQKNGVDEYKIYRDEVTGAKFDRPQLQRLLADIQNKQIDLVIIHKLDRLSRSLKDTFTIIDDYLIKYNVGLISLTENIDSATPSGKWMIGNLALYAQYERDVIRERMIMGKYGRAMTGKAMSWSPGYIPLGYDYKDGLYIPNNDKKIVTEIFTELHDGTKPKSLAKKLTHKGTLNKRWYHTSIKYIARNPVYIGKIKWRGKEFDGNHQPIITKKNFLAVQEILDGYK
ncbi:recombinase family protein [Streptococcus suis]|uniref:recombinase family protein n=1 Tax=Streptococcus suis TaxID=1307 RepID=UPI000CF423C8|nr:recombinase family protein [Streptococcus suis]HEM6081650.1 recombinase family protein [Streptococcus suis]HEM6371689.1 recombinase family protein [Streptococcus suis]